MALKNRSASVLARLKNRFLEEGGEYQHYLQLFVQEEFIRRLSRSVHLKDFLLKGGMLLYVVTDFSSRLTRDMDFDLWGVRHDHDAVERALIDICAVRTENDFVDLKFIRKVPILTTRKDPGVRASLLGKIGKIKVPFTIDIGVCSDVYPTPVLRAVKTQLSGFSVPQVWTYSLENAIAEKLHAIIDHIKATSRVKDYFDILYISDHYAFDGAMLAKTIRLTFAERGTALPPAIFDQIDLQPSLPDVQVMWNHFQPAVTAGIRMETSVERIRTFLYPIACALAADVPFLGSWDPVSKRWDPPKKQ